MKIQMIRMCRFLASGSYCRVNVLQTVSLTSGSVVGSSPIDIVEAVSVPSRLSSNEYKNAMPSKAPAGKLFEINV